MSSLDLHGCIAWIEIAIYLSIIEEEPFLLLLPFTFCVSSFPFLSSKHHWLEVPDNLFWTAPDPISDVFCSRELVCKWHYSPYNLHLVSFSLKVITTCVRFQGPIFCLFSAGGCQVFVKIVIYVLVCKEEILAEWWNTEDCLLVKCLHVTYFNTQIILKEHKYPCSFSHTPIFFFLSSGSRIAQKGL